MQTSGGETFKEGMVCYRGVREYGDQEQATGLDTGDNRKNFGKEDLGWLGYKRKSIDRKV